MQYNNKSGLIINPNELIGNGIDPLDALVE